MQPLALFLVFSGSALLVIGAYAFINRRRLAAKEALRERAEPTIALPASVMRDERKSAVPILDRLLTSHPVTPPIERLLQRAGSHFSVGEFLLGSAALAAIAWLFVEPYGLWMRLGSTVVAALLPTLALRLLRARREKTFDAQLPEAIEMIVNAMRAGFSLQAAIRFAGEESDAPLGEEFMRFYDEQRLGVDVGTALIAMQNRIDSLDLKMFVTALLIQRESGGNLTEILSGLAKIIRDREALRGQIDTLTAEPKFTGWALSALPLIAFFAVMTLNRPMMQPMFDRRDGQILLITAALMIITGFFTLRRMARIET
jgi:tight adherence protein B